MSLDERASIRWLWLSIEAVRGRVPFVQRLPAKSTIEDNCVRINEWCLRTIDLVQKEMGNLLVRITRICIPAEKPLRESPIEGLAILSIVNVSHDFPVVVDCSGSCVPTWGSPDSRPSHWFLHRRRAAPVLVKVESLPSPPPTTRSGSPSRLKSPTTMFQSGIVTR